MLCFCSVYNNTFFIFWHPKIKIIIGLQLLIFSVSLFFTWIQIDLMTFWALRSVSFSETPSKLVPCFKVWDMLSQCLWMYVYCIDQRNSGPHFGHLLQNYVGWNLPSLVVYTGKQFPSNRIPSKCFAFWFKHLAHKHPIIRPLDTWTQY